MSVLGVDVAYIRLLLAGATDNAWSQVLPPPDRTDEDLVEGDERLSIHQVKQFIEEAESTIMTQVGILYSLPLSLSNDHTKNFLKRIIGVLTCLRIYDALSGAMPLPERYSKYEQEYNLFLEAVKNKTLNLAGEEPVLEGIAGGEGGRPSYPQVYVPDYMLKSGIYGVDERKRRQPFGDTADDSWEAG